MTDCIDLFPYFYVNLKINKLININDGEKNQHTNMFFQFLDVFILSMLLVIVVCNFVFIYECT
jgi:hypothetical protein